MWQLDLGNLEKPFDINDCEVRIIARKGPAARPPQTSSGPIRKLNLATLTAPTPTPQLMEINPTKESHLLVGNPSTSDKGKAPLKRVVLVDLDPSKQADRKRIESDSRWIQGVGHVTYDPKGDSWKSEDGTSMFWLLESTSSVDADKERALEVGNVTTETTLENVRAYFYRRVEADPSLSERCPTPPFI